MNTILECGALLMIMILVTGWIKSIEGRIEKLIDKKEEDI